MPQDTQLQSDISFHPVSSCPPLFLIFSTSNHAESRFNPLLQLCPLIFSLSLSRKLFLISTTLILMWFCTVTVAQFRPGIMTSSGWSDTTSINENSKDIQDTVRTHSRSSDVRHTFVSIPLKVKTICSEDNVGQSTLMSYSAKQDSHEISFSFDKNCETWKIKKHLSQK